MAFDVEGARREGYSTAEIVDYLARDRQFDAGGARREGYSDDQILTHLQESQRRSGSWLGRRARDAMETVGNMAGVAELGIPGLGVARSAAPFIQSATGVDITRYMPATPHQMATRAADAAGLGAPQTPEERRNSAAYQGVMGAGLGVGAGLAAGPASAARAMLVGPSQGALGTAANSLVQLGSGAAGGYAAETARQGVEQAGGGTGAQHAAALAAGLLGGAGTAAAGQVALAAPRAAGAMVEPFTEAGRRRIVADVLMRSSADPENLGRRIQAGLAAPDARLPDAVPTAGTAARDPGILLLEQGLRSRTDNAGGVGQPSSAVALRVGEAERNALRERELAGLAGTGTEEGRGQTVRQGLGAANEGFRARVNQLFGIARDRNTGVYPVEPILGDADFRATVSRLMPENGGLGVPAELQNVIDIINNLGSLNLSQAQNLRSGLGGIAGRARAGESQNLPLAAAADALSNALERNLADPRWMQAVAARREQGMATGRDESGANAAGAINRRDQWGAPTLPDSNVMATALRSPESARQVLESLYQGLDAARRARHATDPRTGAPMVTLEQLEQMAQGVRDTRRAMQQQFMQNAWDAARTTGQAVDIAGNMTPVLSPAGFRRFLDNNAEMLPVLFEPGQLRIINRLVNDFSETSLATSTANARGSPTIQNMSVGNLLARVSNGMIDPGTVGLGASAGRHGPLRWLFAGPEQAINTLLTQAVTDPQLASMLLARANPSAMRRAVNYLESPQLAQRIQQAAGTAVIRQGVRTATEQEQPR